MIIILGLILPVAIWLWLLCFRGQFWRCDELLENQDLGVESPTICAVIPARNEADLLPVTMRSLLNQNYSGTLNIVLVDDCSTDGTAKVARETAEALGKLQHLHIVSAAPLPSGWTGKLWAMHQGVEKAESFAPDYILLTDADIEHDKDNLQRLVSKAVQQDLDMASVMVRLRCESFWEKFLIPAFVFFFQKLYPFRWVNNPDNPTAAAAGGCILIRRKVLEEIGGIQVVRQALIDDCALAAAVKSKERKIWLGLSNLTCSLRPYPSLETIWSMVVRTAFTQLNYSPLLLVGTLLGMVVIYVVLPVGFVWSAVLGNWSVAIVGLFGWLLMTACYLPTIRFYRCSFWYAFCLPAVAFLYTLMTFDSALRHWQGRGGAWKGRVYQ